MKDLVYVRMVAYVLSTIAGMIPASWAGLITYSTAEGSGHLVISIEGLAMALVIGASSSLAIFKAWGTK